MGSDPEPLPKSTTDVPGEPIIQPTRVPSEDRPEPALASTLDQTRIAPPPQPPPAPADDRPRVGQRLGDFLLVEELGSGSFATVFLAMQISLGRQVALKVARQTDNEARTLATLEHEHIVPVFSEAVDSERRLHLLCMKFVAGSTLERVLRELAKTPPEQWTGQAILNALDRQTRHEAMFDLAALRDRERLGDSDFIEAVCWMGAKLAEALAHAHARGVLHRDIKPANILLNTYGRPMLSDFNLAHSAQLGQGAGSFGGTLRYMAPEHLEAFLPDGGASRDLVDARSDIYSLGVVLYECLTGKPIFDDSVSARPSAALVRRLCEQRRSGAPSPRQVNPRVTEAVDRVIRRCLDPDPARRYQSAGELAQALDGCRHLRQWERNFPAALWTTRLCQRWPTPMLLLLIFLPHVLGSAVNIAYNTFAIVHALTPQQQQAFNEVLIAYNAVVYPVLFWIGWTVVAPLVRTQRRIAGPERVEAEEANEQRRRAVRLPGLLIVLSCLGWLPGGVIFPLAIHFLAGPLPLEVFGHFLVSFTISGLIATTYSFFGVQVFVLRVLYPRLWVDPRLPRQEARRELATMEVKLRFFQFAAGLIPLTGAILVLSVGGGETLTLVFRLLVVVLIGLGMAGFGVALLASSRVTQTLSVMLGTKRGSGRPRATGTQAGAPAPSAHGSSLAGRQPPRSSDL